MSRQQRDALVKGALLCRAASNGAPSRDYVRSRLGQYASTLVLIESINNACNAAVFGEPLAGEGGGE